MKQFENKSKRVLHSTKPLQATDFEAYSTAGDGKATFELVYTKAMKQAPKFGIKFVGSCNGLICLFVDNDEFILWNPSTRESKELPKPPPSYYAPDVNFGFRFGFGFDISSDYYYKVILLAMPRVVDDDDDNNNAASISMVNNTQVFRLKGNSWRRIEDLQPGLHLDGNGIFLKEKLHWLGIREIAADVRYYVIVSFNLAVEKFQKSVAIPDHIERTVSYAILGVSENLLCLFCINGRSFYEGWIMKETKNSSWIKWFSFGMDRLPKFRRWKRELWCTKTGQALIDYDGMELVIDDLKDGTSQFVAVADWSCRFHSIIYMESLVSPIMIKL